jgi:hypothetical protein
MGRKGWTGAAGTLARPTTEAGADHLFDGSTAPVVDDGGGWEEDEATRVINHSTIAPAGTAADMQMDWDEDEPPTQMRPGAMFETSPLTASSPHLQHEDHEHPDRHDPGEIEDHEAQHAEHYAQHEGIDDGLDDGPEPTQPIEPHHAIDDDPSGDWEEGTELYNRVQVGSPGLPPTPARTTEAAAYAHAQLHHQEPDSASFPTMSGGMPSPFPAVATARHTMGAQAFVSAEAARRHSGVPDTLSAALKVGHRNAWLLVGGVGAGIVALVLIVKALSSGGGVGAVSLTTKPSDAAVTVDGKPVAGSASPFLVSELAPGDHVLVVSKPGFTEYRGNFSVARGDHKPLPLIELAASEVGFAVRSTPAGAAVWLDGQTTGQVSPARLVGVTPGIHRLQLKLDGYSDYELQLFVPEGTVLQLPAAELTASAGAAGDSSASDVAEKPSRSWRSHARSHDDDDDEDSARSSPARSRSWRSRASSDKDDDAEPTASLADTKPAPALAAAPAANSKFGTLRINSRPWAQVIVDGRLVGNTPQQSLLLSAGTHKVQLVNQQMGMSKTVHIPIPAGQVVTQVLNLTD